MIRSALKISLLIAITVGLQACGTRAKAVNLNIHQINSLATLEKNTGNFKGMEFLASPVSGALKSRINIFYVHGIGWTENPDGAPLADDFLAGVARAYNIDLDDSLITSDCGNKGEVSESSSHILISSNHPTNFQTAIPGSTLMIENLVCMDNTVLKVDDTLEFSVYRVFWDDLFWNALQYPHVGQDDDTGSSKDIAQLRRKYNRKLKDELVNYGFSDAVMYLGPAGAELRRAVQGAMCSAALDASGHSFSMQGQTLSYQDVCALASWRNLDISQFAFVTESLGSKITYDVLRESMSDGVENAIDAMIVGSEFYMLANQIPLLSLNDLNLIAPAPVSTFSDEQRPKIIALSELNDFLTYELIPFYDHLWMQTTRGPQELKTRYGTYYQPAPKGGTIESRRAIIQSLGFDVIDVRLEFADRLIPILDSLVDPLQAHGGHSAEPELMLYMLCGSKNGKLNDKACLATELADERDT